MTMELYLNGERYHWMVADGHSGQHTPTLSDLIEHLELQGRRVAVEVNGVLVPRTQHDQQPLQVGDRVEIVQAIGGG